MLYKQSMFHGSIFQFWLDLDKKSRPKAIIEILSMLFSFLCHLPWVYISMSSNNIDAQMNTFKIDIHINIYNAKYHQADNDKLTQWEVGNGWETVWFNSLE